MNKVLLGWNVVLTALVVFLLVNKGTMAVEAEEEIPATDSSEMSLSQDTTPREMAKVVYINNDTLFKYFDMYEDLKDELQAEKTKSENRLARGMEKMEQDYNDLVRRANEGTLTPTESERGQARLLKERERLVNMEQDLSAQLVQKEADLVRRIKRTIAEFLERKREEYGYDFVLSKSDIDGIHYASADREITLEVVDGLNREYRAKKEGKKAE